MDKIGLALLLSTSVLNASASGLIKKAFGGNSELFADGVLKAVWKIVSNFYAISGVFVLGFSFILFSMALSRVNLSIGYPLMSGTAFMLIFLTSALLFKETITVWGITGVLSIFLGIVLISVKG
jgi:multidrug transporter EmrE-like cation transporter